MTCTQSVKNCCMTLAELSTHWSTAFRPNSNSQIGLVTKHDGQSIQRKQQTPPIQGFSRSRPVNCPFIQGHATNAE